MRKGSITVFALIAMLVVFMICLYLSHMAVMQSHLQNNLRDKLQNNYDLETVLNVLINDLNDDKSEIYKSIIKYCNAPLRDYKDTINLNISDKRVSTVANIKYKLDDNKTIMDVVIKSPIKNYSAFLNAQIEFVNEIFTFNNLSFLNNSTFTSRSDLEQEFYDFWASLNDNYLIPPLKSGMKSISLYHSEEITLKRIDSNKYHVYRKEAYDNYNLLNDEAFIYIENKANYDKVKLIIDSDNNNDYFKGIIYVEGDVYIVDNFKFNGIIILNGGKIYIEDGKSAIITGKLIASDNFEIPEGLELKYSPEIMNKYGIYLPFYIKGELRNSKIVY
ncbi:hypothetical protein E4100_06870 [Soehngenia longivitae]|uniref:Uncharacterized protein n=1 Tax=Soehngenia longivitae TaxID=2562294 RepID=A0A4Z0D345_9FIRM|nr:hypothetical protein [Soehngenia longivitae]TFZ39748.1 hypothetical protein E4100_06870 [Soehngenia longivitae]